MPPPGSPPPNQPSGHGPFGPRDGATPQIPPPHAPPPPPGQQVPPGYAPPPPGRQPPPGYAPFTPHNPGTLHDQLAGFGTRLGAWIVDGILYGLVMVLVAIPGIYFMIDAFSDCSRSLSNDEIMCLAGEFKVGTFLIGLGLLVVGLLLVATLYLRALATTGQTWGRKLIGVKVIDERTGGAPGWGKAIGRSAFAWFISGQILYIGYLWMLWDDRKQTLHDKVSGTHVVQV
ncbi:RDD family protein [Ilumatobacter coccineus]|nr:RDD family protein [Ilumatobacter coccineus]